MALGRQRDDAVQRVGGSWLYGGFKRKREEMREEQDAEAGRQPKRRKLSAWQKFCRKNKIALGGFQQCRIAYRNLSHEEIAALEAEDDGEEVWGLRSKDKRAAARASERRLAEALLQQDIEGNRGARIESDGPLALVPAQSHLENCSAAESIAVAKRYRRADTQQRYQDAAALADRLIEIQRIHREANVEAIRPHATWIGRLGDQFLAETAPGLPYIRCLWFAPPLSKLASKVLGVTAEGSRRSLGAMDGSPAAS